MKRFITLCLVLALMITGPMTATAYGSIETADNEVVSDIIDTCDSLEYVYAYGDASMIEVQTASSNYIGDDYRIRRMSTEDEYFEYRTNAAMKQAELICYYHPNHLAIAFYPFDFYVSSDGMNWTTVDAAFTEETNLEGTDWLKYKVNINTIPENATYLRIQFPEGYPDSWAPQVGNVQITVYGENGAFVPAEPASLEALEADIQKYTEALAAVQEGTEVGDITPGAKAEFQNYLDAATAALNSFDENTTARQIQIEQSTLKRAYETMLTRTNSAGDLSNLQTVINQANTLLESAVEGTAAGQYVPGAKASLAAAITTAEALLSQSDVTQFQVCDAVNDLRTAMSDFGAKKNLGDAYETVFDDYVSRDGDQLIADGEEFRFVSVNIASTYGLQYPSWNNATVMRPVTEYEQEDLLKTIKALGGQVARTYVFPIQGGTCTDEEGCVYLLSSDGSYSEEEFVVVDQLLALANEQGIRLIIPFIDTWEHHGGIPQFAAIYGKTASDFYTDRTVIEGFKSYIRTILTRVNTITGVPYYEDKAILAWETGNELSAPDAWTEEITAFIKSLDPNHLVMDGNYGISDAALENPNVDITSNHYYNATSTTDFADRYLRDAWKADGKKAFVVGEYGLSDNATEMALMDAVVTEGSTGCLIWCLYGHSADGGFYNSGDLHWPGKNADDKALMLHLREKAYAVQGSTAPALSAPEAPVLLPAENQFEMAWRGSVGASSYRLERSETENGEYTVVASDLAEGIGTAYTPAKDETAEVGKTYYYRMVALNSAGESAPSNVIAVNVLYATDVRELLSEIEAAETLLETENASEYDSGAFEALTEAVEAAKTVSTSATTAAEVNEAIDELQDAVMVFNESKKTANSTILFDDFNDLNLVESQTNIEIETGDANGVFPSDNPRIKRSTTEDGVLIYHCGEDIVELKVEGYLWPNRANAAFVQFYTSTDGETYTALENVSYTVEDNLSGQWKSVAYSASELPADTHYVKIVLSNSSERYNPELDSVRLYGRHVNRTTVTDDFSDAALAGRTLNNLEIMESNAVHAEFGKYLRFSSNATSTADGTAYVIYDVEELVDSCALESVTAWYSPHNTNTYKSLEISLSSDGETFTPVTTTDTVIKDHNWSTNEWMVKKQEVTLIPEGTRYIKVAIRTSNAASYTAHICLVEFTCTEHSYSGDCDTMCDECGAVRTEAAAHTYDNCQDTACNVCAATREAQEHTGGTATCTAKATCSACGMEYGEMAAHVYKEVWNQGDASGHWHDCENCTGHDTAVAHTPGAEATETTSQTCTVCGYVIKIALGHVHKTTLVKEAAATCTAAGQKAHYSCTCGKIFEDSAATKEITDKNTLVIAMLEHDWKAATCTTPKTCAVCRATEGDAAGHKLTEVKEKAATYTAEGNIAYFACSECDKYFADAEGKTEITKDSVVIPQLIEKDDDSEQAPGTSSTPTTGDNSLIYAWMALALLSAMAIAAITVLIVRNRRAVN